MFKDPVLKKLQKKYPAPNFEDRSEKLFERLVDSIISQQLSVKAADIIFNRFLDIFKTKPFPTPKDVLETNAEKIRKAGISYRKIEYIKGIAQAFLDEKIDIKQIKSMTDEEVIIELTKLKGIGKWTAEMILIFSLQRPDVFSIGDAGLRRAIENLYGISNQEKMLILSESWKPHRSTASWYLWRSLEND